MERRKLQPILKKAGKELAFRNTGNRVAHISFVSSTGVVAESSNRACHAGLNIEYEHEEQIKKIITPEYIINRIQNVYTSHFNRTVEDLELFYDYMFNFSPWKKTFQSKSASRAVKQGYTVSYADKPSNLVAGGLIATRLQSEHTERLHVWLGLVKQGINPDLAYYISHVYIKGIHLDEDTLIYKLRNHHSALDGSGANSIKNLSRFINHKPYRLDGLYSKTKEYSGIYSTWSKNSKGGFTKRLDAAINVAKKGSENTNPFSDVPNKNVGFDEGIEILAKELNKHYEMIKGEAA